MIMQRSSAISSKYHRLCDSYLPFSNDILLGYSKHFGVVHPNKFRGRKHAVIVDIIVEENVKKNFSEIRKHDEVK